MKELVFATNNRHKSKELAQILGPDFQIKTLEDIGCHTDIPETADTLDGNALIKARYVREHYGIDCFAEDTGLEVEALGGAPGVHTARFAGPQKNAEDNIRKLLESLEGQSNRRARFRTVIALIRNGEEHLFEGICQGNIALRQEGSGGFGYDPVFIPDGYQQTFASIGDDIKNAVSHRARAVAKLTAFLSRVDG